MLNSLSTSVVSFLLLPGIHPPFRRAIFHPGSCIEMERVSPCLVGPRQDSEQSEDVPLPEYLTREPHMHGIPAVLYLDNGGWLIGFNWGEFEGGLWSANQDGSETKNLLPSVDVHALVPVPGGVVVLAGVAQATLDEGSAFFVPVSEWDKAKAFPILDLHSSPEAYIQKSPDTILVATNKAILRINASGVPQTLFELPNGSLFPRSVLLADRTIYVGMRGYILRLLPQSTGYKSEWLSPPEGRRANLD
jgi:hypothetical protein